MSTPDEIWAAHVEGEEKYLPKKIADTTTLRAQIKALTRYSSNGEAIHFRGDYGEFVLRDEVLHLVEEAHVGGAETEIEIDKETAKELLEYIKHQYIKARYTRVHELVRKLYEFTGAS